MDNLQFDFGENWKDFSQKAITKEKIEQSFIAFRELTNGISLQDKTFIDIGFGQGLGLLNAATLGANCFGCDINPKCKEVLDFNKQKFPQLNHLDIPAVIGSILDNSTIKNIKKYNNEFDIVHSWGVLHHTGKMWEAINNAASLVKREGYFIIAIYNRHWSSLSWKFIKWIYNISPNFIRKLMLYIFSGIIFIAKFLVTFKNPLKKERGMSFYYDVVDWVGEIGRASCRERV